MSDDVCECCGAPGESWYPYGTYCRPCGDAITHPTGYGWCFVPDDAPDGRVHKNHRTKEEKARIRRDFPDSG